MKRKTRSFKNLIKISSFIIVFSLSNGLQAQHQADDSLSTSETKTFKQAINFCPLALVFGIYSMNYERLITPHHGILIRADYEAVPKNYSDANIDLSGKAGILNYRYHLCGKLDSPFIGAFGRYRVYSGDGELNNGTFDFDLNEFTVGLNIGKRWILKNGLNLNLVWGYGIFTDNMNSSNTSKDVLDAIAEFQNNYDLYNGMYGEFSIGYAF